MSSWPLLASVSEVAASFRSARIELDAQGVLWVAFQPESSGISDLETFAEIGTLFDFIGTSDEVRVVVVSSLSAGGSFALSPGGMSPSRDSPPPAPREMLTRRNGIYLLVRLYRNMAFLEQPVIASIDGDALTVGTSFSQHCDIVLASDRSRFGDLHVLRGLNAPIGGYLWPLHVNPHAAAELLYTGEIFSAERAHALGMVNHVYPAEQLREETAKLARRIASISPFAIGYTKRLIYRRLQREQADILSEAVAWESFLTAAQSQSTHPTT